MKRLLLLLLAIGGCTAQPAASKPGAVPGDLYAQAILYRGSVTPQRFYTPGIVTQQGKAATLRQAFAAAKPGDLIQVGFGVYDFGKDEHAILPDGVTVRGMGRDQTTLLGSVVSDDKGTNFALQNTVVEDLTLKNDCWNPGEDGRCVGFDNGLFGVGPGPYTAAIRRCRLWCRDWTVYCWSQDNVLAIEDCEIVTGRVGIAAENSGNGQDISVKHSKIIGDASLSNSIGATSTRANGGVLGCISRGGPLELIDCEMDLKGRSQVEQDRNQSWTPRVCGIVDRGGGGDVAAGNTRVSVYNLRCRVDPNGADPSRCFDLNLEFDYVQNNLRANWANCWGSATDGGLARSW